MEVSLRFSEMKWLRVPMSWLVYRYMSTIHRSVEAEDLIWLPLRHLQSIQTQAELYARELWAGTPCGHSAPPNGILQFAASSSCTNLCGCSFELRCLTS